MRVQNLILGAIGAITLATVASAQQVEVISDADEAAAAGFSQPQENRAHPIITGSDDFGDSAGGVKSLQVTLTNTNYSSPTCSDRVTPSCGGWGGIAVKKTSAIEEIAALGTFTFEFYDDAQLDQYPVSAKVACTVSNGSTTALFLNVQRLGNNQWRSIAIELDTASFSRSNTEKTLTQWGDSFCPTGRDKTFELFISVGARKYNPASDEAHYFDRFQVGDNSVVYDFDLPEGEELPEAEVPVVATAVPLLPGRGLEVLAVLLMWLARRALC